MRLRGRAGTLLLLLALLLVTAACGADDETGTVGDRTVDTVMGEVDVPAEPQRVVAADFYAAFTLVDLGLDPVGVVADYADASEPYADKLSDAEVVGNFEELDYDAILATEPDVIVRSVDTEKGVYERLTDIAPTVVVSFEKLSLQEVTTSLGEALGRAEMAQTVVTEFEDRAHAVADAHQAALDRFDFALATPNGDGGWWLYGPAWTDLTVLAEAGVRLSPISADLTKPTASYSWEQIPVLKEADVMLFDETWDNSELLESRLWKRLPAVQEGRVFSITTGTSSTGHALELLDRLEEILGELE